MMLGMIAGMGKNFHPFPHDTKLLTLPTGLNFLSGCYHMKYTNYSIADRLLIVKFCSII